MIKVYLSGFSIQLIFFLLRSIPFYSFSWSPWWTLWLCWLPRPFLDSFSGPYRWPFVIKPRHGNIFTLRIALLMDALINFFLLLTRIVLSVLLETVCGSQVKYKYPLLTVPSRFSRHRKTRHRSIVAGGDSFFEVFLNQGSPSFNQPYRYIYCY